jgi:hypothetical protein
MRRPARRNGEGSTADLLTQAIERSPMLADARKPMKERVCYFGP